MSPHPRRAAGVAMVAVLWIVAALSLLVIGAGKSVRQQAAVTSVVQDEVRGQALGAAAIALTLQALQLEAPRPQGIQHAVLDFAQTSVAVQVMPANGLIPLNSAPAPLLAALLRVAGGLAPASADALAQQLVDWRDSIAEPPSGRLRRGSASQRRFEAVEDLLQVPGLTYAIYAAVAPLVSVDLDTGARINPLAAPPGVLAVLAQGDRALAGRIAAQRDAGAVGIDTTALDPQYLGAGSTSLYRIQADVPVNAGKILRFTQDVALQSAEATGAPWRVLRNHKQLLSVASGPR